MEMLREIKKAWKDRMEREQVKREYLRLNGDGDNGRRREKGLRAPTGTEGREKKKLIR